MKQYNRQPMKKNGFSIIELMIVVLIIGILASVALPAYKTYVMRSARGDGMTALLDIMRAQEDFFANEFTYTDNLAELNYDAIQKTSSGKYKITASACDGEELTQCVELKASPQLGQVEDGGLTLDSRGNRKHNGNDDWPK